MIIYAKIGTHSQCTIRVERKRNYPKVGDVIRFKSFPAVCGEKWRQAKVDKIKNIGYRLCYLSL